MLITQMSMWMVLTISGLHIMDWATCNLGAVAPKEEGGLYGWGDPTGEHLEQCNSDRYDYYLSDEAECLALYGGENPLADISGTEYDVVRAMWGTDWRMPTSRELSNLSRYCTVEWTTQNGVQGCVFTSTINGNSIFLPYSPQRTGTNISWSEWNTASGEFHQSSLYWSGSLNEEEPEHASCLYFDNNGNSWIARGGYRYQGMGGGQAGGAGPRVRHRRLAERHAKRDIGRRAGDLLLLPAQFHGSEGRVAGGRGRAGV